MLNPHLAIKARPLVNEMNAVLWKNLRISVLSDRLFRIERSERGEFCDEATAAVFFRDFAPVDYSVRESGSTVYIGTGR